jgi:hypothetical protein
VDSAFHIDSGQTAVSGQAATYNQGFMALVQLWLAAANSDFRPIAWFRTQKNTTGLALAHGAPGFLTLS